MTLLQYDLCSNEYTLGETTTLLNHFYSEFNTDLQQLHDETTTLLTSLLGKTTTVFRRLSGMTRIVLERLSDEINDNDPRTTSDLRVDNASHQSPNLA